MAKEFSLDEDRLLIQNVEQYQAIYNTLSPDYREQSAKDDAWKQVSGRVGRSVEDCKWRWKNIRDTYGKRKKMSKTDRRAKKKWHLETMMRFLDSVQYGRKSKNHSSSGMSEGIIDIIDTAISSAYEAKPNAACPGNKDSPKNVQRATIPPTSPMDTTPPLEDAKRTRTLKKNAVKDTEMEDLAETPKEQSRQSQTTEQTATLTSNVAGTHDDHVDLFFKSVAMSVKVLPRHLIGQAKLRTIQMLIELETESSTVSHVSNK
ncbi:uncharacterized protein LOC135198679 [Macrobrachium nipponense]|uniref:uncharacterized protein LOC135198679 n=1 Tax=Macrobrachium nipponense TaxID=159736 RepID=UPI0030C7A887